jgi:small subunit ribosomal protein S17
VNEEQLTQERGRRKVRTGVVVSDGMDKTVVVRIDRSFRHPRDDKTVRRSKKLAAHDEAKEAQVGDRVRVVETRPLSKTKRWRLMEIVEKAK